MNMHQITYEWTEALKAPFDAESLAALHADYQEAVRRDAEHAALYAEQRAIVAAECEAAREACRAELAGLSKAALMDRLGVTDRRNWTRERLIETFADDAASRVEHEHQRVARIWRQRYPKV